jgi:hypothetical protein
MTLHRQRTSRLEPDPDGGNAASCCGASPPLLDGLMQRRITTSPALGAACGDSEAPSLDRAAAVRDAAALAGVRVLFGHHSVGRDVLDGLRAVAGAGGIDVRSVAVGENGRPFFKLVDFERVAIRADVDVVMMKLCFADFTPSTDAHALFAAYASAIRRIRAARPDVVVVHVTPPLHTTPRDPRALFLRVLGRTTWEDAANARRAEFADAVRGAFAGEPIFDLAHIESTAPGGVRTAIVVDGRAVPVLWPGYTSDGGHLLALGKDLAAAALLHTLALARRGSRRAT